jgi:putative membrane protein
MTPSDPSAERRLHPLSILFSLASQLRAFALPVIAVTAGVGMAGRGWELWMLPAIVPVALLSLSRYLTLRYRFEAHEMVIRSGLLFRNERHVPYDRIQNLDAVQNVLHRLFKVVEVRVETGGAKEAEAKLSVLSLAAFEEMRGRVLGERAAAARSGEAQTAGEPRVSAPAGTAAAATAVAAPAEALLLELPLREQVLCGLIDGRGGVILAAGFGLLWELGLMDRFTGDWFGGDMSGRRFFRSLAESLFGDGGLALFQVAQAAGVVFALLGVLRFSSVAWAVLRLHGFRLSRAGEDLRIEMGLLTRISATIPLRRIQTLTVREGPLHRLFGRVSVRVETAGGDGGGGGSGGSGESGKGAGAAAQREWIAPLLRREALPGLLRELLPDLDPTALAEPGWQAVHPRAFRRVLKRWLLVTLPLALPGLAVGWWGPLVLLPLLVLWAWVGARGTVARLGWAVISEEKGGAVLSRSGWLWRRTSIVRFGKIQAVALHESPWDRRAAMARVRVDTAGAGESSHGVNIPYLARETADGLSRRLAGEAAGTSFRW